MTPELEVLIIRLAFLLVVFYVLGFLVYKVAVSVKRIRARQRKEYDAYQEGLDDRLSAVGHTEEYVERDRTIRVLKAKDRDAKIGYYAAWIGGILCLIFFPPIGIFLTGFAIIMTVREGHKLRKEMRDTAYEIKAVRDGMPEK